MCFSIINWNLEQSYNENLSRLIFVVKLFSILLKKIKSASSRNVRINFIFCSLDQLLMEPAL